MFWVTTEDGTEDGREDAKMVYRPRDCEAGRPLETHQDPGDEVLVGPMMAREGSVLALDRSRSCSQTPRGDWNRAAEGSAGEFDSWGACVNGREVLRGKSDGVGGLGGDALEQGITAWE